MGKDLEGRGRGLIEILSHNLCREIEENHENPFRTAGVTSEILTEHLAR
jgi:hypothetical protein